MEHTTNCNNRNCNAELTIGSEIRYDKNYNAYCDNNECSEGIPTIGSTVIEKCWFE